ncbi:unnamed protein product [Blepharisma stoltei]|uniref:Receptor ligand binding region domain-containing protein n=1 Tax=Blepharisma stoltei TaxID=1481888 RepID=A0AAU9I3C9_9CILI|nr:unnamed protein product [Blepharisma stoltei]
MFFWFIFVAFAATIQVPFGIIYSTNTDSRFIARLYGNGMGLENRVKLELKLPFSLSTLIASINLTDTSDLSVWAIPPAFLDSHTQLIIDATNSLAYTQFLSYQAIQMDFVHIVVQRSFDNSNEESICENTIFFETNYQAESKAFFDLISNYGWENLGLAYDEKPSHINWANSFKELITGHTMKVLDEIIIDLDDKNSGVTITSRLQGTTQNSGARVILVCTDSMHAAQLLHAADISVMGGSGFAWIFCDDAMVDLGEVSMNSYADLDSSTFGILKSGAIGFSSPEDAYLSGHLLGNIYSALTLICQYLAQIDLSQTKISGKAIVNYILTNPSTPTLDYPIKFDTNRMKVPSYSIYNIQNFQEYYVGYWNLAGRSVTIKNTIIWPGFTTTVPNDKIPLLTICLLYPAHDQDGNTYAGATAIKNGFDLGVSEVNSLTIMGDYQIIVEYKDTYMNTDLAASNIKSLASLNILAYIGPYTTSETVAYSKAISATSDPKPLISYGATWTNLTSTDNYPQLIRTIEADDLEGVALALFIQEIGWKKIGVIYTLDEYGIDVYSSFMSNIKTLGITVKNDVSKRGITYDPNLGLTSKTKNSVDEALSNIVRHQVKVIIYIGHHTVGYQVALTAHKKELYGSDYSWVGSRWLTDELEALIEKSSSSKKIYEVLNGAFGITYRSAIGDAGSKFETNYAAKYKSDYSVYGMYAYDTVYLIAYTVAEMISNSEDFNSGTDLTKSLRSADFTGASGVVKFIDGSNDRSGFGFSIVNMQKNAIITVQIYDPSNPSVFSSVTGTSLIFGGDRKSPPSDEWSSSYDCPFAKNMVSVDWDGIVIVIVIGFVLFLLTLVLSYFAYRKWKQLEYQEITEPVVRSWKDNLVIITIGIEFFQFIAISPTFPALKSAVSVAANIFMVDFLKMTSGSKSTYWTFLIVVSVLCYTWFFLILLIMANAEKWLIHVPLCQRFMGLVNTMYLPFFGNTMFLPFMTMLLDVFVCDHKAQDKSFVWRDCYMNCWTDDHYPYIIMSALALSCYQPIAVFSRPLWQQAKTGVNLMVKPFFLLFKTCVQILLIAVGKSLQGSQPIAHGVLFSFLIFCFSVITYKIKPFNYGRCNLWEFASLVGVFYISFLATLSNAGQQDNIAWFIALFIGWGIIAIVTIIIQKKYFPSLLVPAAGKPKNKIYDALKFQKDESNEMDNSVVSLRAHNQTPLDDSRVEENVNERMNCNESLDEQRNGMS